MNTQFSLIRFVKKHSIKFLLVIIAAILTLFIQQGKLILFWDQFYPFAPAEAIDSFGSLWNKSFYPGQIDASGVNLLPLIFLIYIFSWNGQFLFLSQFIILFLALFIAFLSSFTLNKLFVERFNNKISTIYKTIISLAGSLFYVVNLYSAVFVFRIINTNFLLFAFLPLCIILVYKLSKKFSAVNFLAFIFINSFLLAPVFTNLAFAITYFLFFSGLVLTLIYKSSNKLAVFKRFVVIGLAVFLTSIWWITPQILGLSNTFDKANSIGGLTTLIENSSQTSVFSVSELKGEPPLFDNCETWPSSWCNNDSISSSWWGFIYILLVGVTICIKICFRALYFINQKWRPFTVFTPLLITTSLFIFFISGLNSSNPLYHALYWLYTKSDWIATAMRDSYHKLGNFLLILMCLLILYCIGYIVHLIEISYNSKKYKYIRTSLIAVIILITLLPILSLGRFYLSGEIVPFSNGNKTGARFSLSNDYKNLKSKLESIETENIVVMPLQGEIVSFNQLKDPVVGFDIFRNLTFAPTLSNLNGGSVEKDIYDSLNYYDQNGLTDKLISSLEDLGLDTILINKNESDFFQSQRLLKDKNLKNYREYKNQFSNRNDIKLIEDNSHFLIYKVINAKPSFFTANIINNRINNLVSPISLIKFPQEQSYFDNNQGVIPIASTINLDSSALQVESIDNSYPKELISNSQDPKTYKLTFEKSFDQNVLKDNFLGFRFKCLDCYFTISAEYTSQNDKVITSYINSINPTTVTQGTSYSSNEFYNLLYDFYLPQTKLSAIYLQISPVKKDKSSYKLEFQNIGLVKQNSYSQPDKDQNISKVCVGSDENPSDKVKVSFKSVYLPISNINTEPYLQFKIKNSDKSKLYFNFTGIDKNGQLNGKFTQATFKDFNIKTVENGYFSSGESLLEIDLRNLNFESIKFFIPHIVNEPYNPNQVTGCFNLISRSKYSLYDSNKRLIDYLDISSELKKDKVVQPYTECITKDYYLSPNSKVDCKEFDNLITLIPLNKDWNLINSNTHLEPQSERYLGVFNTYKIKDLRSFEVEYKPYKYVQIAQLVSLGSFVILIVYLISKSGFKDKP